METKKLKKNALFNPEGDTETRLRKMIGGNTTNLNDFNNMPVSYTHLRAHET